MNELNLFLVCQLISVFFGWIGNRYLLHDNTRLGQMVAMSHVVPQFFGWLMLFGMVFKIESGLTGILSMFAIGLFSGMATLAVCLGMYKLIALKHDTSNL